MAARTSTTTTRRTSSSSKSFGARMTAKVGPLPVWAWALAILVVGYLVYRFSGSSSSSSSASTDTSSGDATAPTTDTSTSGSPGPDQTTGDGSSGGAAGLNDELLSQLSGFQGSLDALTAAVLSSSAFLPGTGDSGSGSIVPNGVPSGSAPLEPATVATGAHGGTAPAPAPAAKVKPAPTLVSEHGQGGGYTPPANVRYYTYAPGKAPKGQKANEAPARVAGKTLHFASGRGYYYA